MKTKEITVSPETMAFIECLESLNKHWQQTSDALSKTYYENTSCQMMEAKYRPAFENMKAVIHGFIMESIENNIGQDDHNQI